MKVLIYGLGKEALLAKKSVRKEHMVIGFTDSFANIKNYAGLTFFERKNLKTQVFDYIILALSNRNVSECVKAELVKEGIEAKKIINFMSLFARQKIDKVMCRSRNQKIDGLIFGISHALFGINPSYLPGVWKNLSMTSEDLYYHYMILKKCATNYSDIISNLKYVIVDLYDYTIFNYDLSLTTWILNYWSNGGYAEDIHNFDKNRNYNYTVEEEMKNAGFYLPTINDQDLLLADYLFDLNVIKNEMEFLYISRDPGNDGFRDYPFQSQLDKIIPEKPELPYELYYMGAERYPETIEENITILREFIKLLMQINSKIKIYFLLMPRFGNVEKYHTILLEKEKKSLNVL